MTHRGLRVNMGPSCTVDVRLLDLMSVLKVSNMCLFDNVQERCKSILGQMHKESWYC